MKYSFIFLFVILFPSVSLAEVSKIEIPGEGWHIAFDAPPLSKKEESKKEGRYIFRAASGRFNISLLVEPPRGPGDTHQASYSFYWPRAVRNPSIAKETVVVTHHPSYFRVEYDVVGVFGGRQFTQKNVHYYIAFNKRWINVHIFMMFPAPEDAGLFAAFDKSLTYGLSHGMKKK